MAFTLIGGTLAGTILTLLFLPTLYAIWFRIKVPSGELDPISHAAEAGKDNGIFKEASLEAMQRNQFHRFRLLSALEGTSGLAPV